MRFTAAITKEDELFVARCLEVDIASQGTTVEDSLANLQEALELYFEDEPAPQVAPPPIIAPFEVRVARVA